ncbi:2Fe-2S iron-sulfur cluster-binding protein [Streptomyces sp. NPDC059917]|uniref:2Fe-2S iron-sulfur cluster-binding protein n=1 Tax=Streptomyces sp. NPDC059917 TaxID=3347002 RepID=UPI00365CF52B
MTATDTGPLTAAAPQDARPEEVRLVTQDGAVIDVACAPGRSVLDAAADAGHLLPALCRKGTCGACCATVTSGAYDTDEWSPQALGADRIRAGGTLLCRTRPRGPLTVSLPYERSRVLTGKIAERTAEVLSLEHLAEDLIRLSVRLHEDEEHGSGAEFEPGQFAQLRLPGTQEPRAYSYANAPNWDGELEFWIRTRPDGAFSGPLRARVRPGDTLDVLGPQGAFGLVETGLRPRWFVAGGTGVAPMLSMARRMAEFDEPHPIRFYLSGRTPDELPAAAAVADLLADLPALEPVFCVKEGADARPWLRTGRLIEVLRADLDAVLRDGSTTPDVYVCGSPGLIDAVERLAVELGFPAERVLAEKFATSEV